MSQDSWVILALACGYLLGSLFESRAWRQAGNEQGCGFKIVNGDDVYCVTRFKTARQLEAAKHED